MLKVKNNKVCFFSKSGKEQILREQYSIQDINILKELGYDVIIATRFSEIPKKCKFYFSWWASGSIYPFIIAKIMRKPIITVAGGNEAMLYKDSLSNNPKGYLTTNKLKRFAVYLTLRFSNVVLIVSDFMRNDVIKLGAKNVIKVYNSIDINKFKPLEVDRTEITTIFRFDKDVVELKRGLILLKSIPTVVKNFPNQVFTFIGGYGNALEEMKFIAKELNIESNVRFINEMPNDQIVSWLQKSIVYIQISDTETFGVAVAEAMSCETPVVVSKRGALPEVAAEFGIYVNHNDPEDVARGILKVLNLSMDERSNLGEKLRKKIIDNFTFAKRKEKIEQIIKNIT